MKDRSEIKPRLLERRTAKTRPEMVLYKVEDLSVKELIDHFQSTLIFVRGKCLF
ncbi:MAG: hypothetical protein LBE18_02740 [Planctomycetaceae bacterium]|nr:hypothetical protein [Planctomycetaceae bacterium]